ncbi:MAG: calcium-binding protein [Pseudomonadota bacterium]
MVQTAIFYQYPDDWAHFQSGTRFLGGDFTARTLANVSTRIVEHSNKRILISSDPETNGPQEPVQLTAEIVGDFSGTIELGALRDATEVSGKIDKIRFFSSYGLDADRPVLVLKNPKDSVEDIVSFLRLKNGDPNLINKVWQNLLDSEWDITIAGGVSTVFTTANNDIVLVQRGDELTGRVAVHALKGDDVVTGHSGRDVVYGGGGNDQIFGKRGDDAISGEAGKDRLEGQDGNDYLEGGKGNDVLKGGRGDDLLSGGEGRDLLLGGPGDDFVYGTNLIDPLSREKGDVLKGGRGSDDIVGSLGDDRLFGGSGADGLAGREGADFLKGGGGDDNLSGGPGRDVFDLTGTGNGTDRTDIEWEIRALYVSSRTLVVDFEARFDNEVILLDRGSSASLEIIKHPRTGQIDNVHYLGFVFRDLSGRKTGTWDLSYNRRVDFSNPDDAKTFDNFTAAMDAGILDIIDFV